MSFELHGTLLFNISVFKLGSIQNMHSWTKKQNDKKLNIKPCKVCGIIILWTKNIGF